MLQRTTPAQLKLAFEGTETSEESKICHPSTVDNHGNTWAVLHVLQTLQEDLDRRTPVGVLTLRLQDAETPDRIVELLRVRRYLGPRDDPLLVVVLLA